MKEILKDKGYKITPARLAILEIFASSKIPLNAEDMLKKLKGTKIQKKINSFYLFYYF